MRTREIGAALSCALLVVAGCKMGSKVPGCGDPETTLLLKQVLHNMATERNHHLQSIELESLEKIIHVEMAVADSFDENIGKYQCSASVAVPVSDEKALKLDVGYSAQIADNDQFIVRIEGLAVADVRELALAMDKGNLLLQGLVEFSVLGTVGGGTEWAALETAEGVMYQFSPNTAVGEKILTDCGGYETRCAMNGTAIPTPDDPKLFSITAVYGVSGSR